jgi:hypothetical protein
MGRFRLAGALWIIGGLSSALLVVFVLDSPFFVALLAAGGVVGLAIGLLLVARPSADVVRWSNVAGVAWLIAFGALTLTQLDKPVGQLVSGVWLTAFGVGGALAAYWRRSGGTGPTNADGPTRG